jgi:V/A-type H+-transporting ATPase subunit E
MPEELQELIEKIHQEGVKAAEDKAGDIEAEAKRQAEEIIKKAGKEADKIISDAKDEVSRMRRSGEESLKQAGRNVVISLKKEITSILDRLIALRVREGLSSDAMSKIIPSLIKNYRGEKGAIVVTLNKKDLKDMEKSFLSKLKAAAKKGITLRGSEEIQGGFFISYDSDKSHYDFTDKSLAEYISSYLKPALGELLKSASGGKDKKHKR